MSRWAETAIILTVGVVVTIGLMLFARWRTPEVEDPYALLDRESLETVTAEPSESQSSTSESPHALAVEADEETGGQGPSIRLPPHPVGEEKEAAAEEALPTNMLKALEEMPIIRIPPPTDDKTAAVEEASNKAGEPDSEDVEEAEEEEAALGTKKDIPAAREAERELRVLEQARQSLQRLHQLLLRPDVTRASAQAEADKLTQLLKGLPEASRKEVGALVKQGYDRRVQRANRTDGLSDRSASGVSVGNAALGKPDDRPGDLRALDRKIRQLRVQVGATRTGDKGNTAPTGVQTRQVGAGVQPVSP
jgi:hypothetical protein